MDHRAAYRGFDVHITKALIYGPIASAIAVESLNLAYHSRQAERRAEAPDPVQLHPAYVKDAVPRTSTDTDR